MVLLFIIIIQVKMRLVNTGPIMNVPGVLLERIREENLNRGLRSLVVQMLLGESMISNIVHTPEYHQQRGIYSIASFGPELTNYTS